MPCCPFEKPPGRFAQRGTDTLRVFSGKIPSHCGCRCFRSLFFIKTSTKEFVVFMIVDAVTRLSKNFCERCPDRKISERCPDSYHVGILQGNACINHIHMCLSIPPKYAVATIVWYIKGKSEIIVFERYSRHKRNFKGHSFWTGNIVSTVGLDEEKIRKYIRDKGINESVNRYDLMCMTPFGAARSR
jgi:REP element-mobilizing transposase RayT